MSPRKTDIAMPRRPPALDEKAVAAFVAGGAKAVEPKPVTLAEAPMLPPEADVQVETTRLTVYVPVRLAKQLKVAAVMDDMTLSALAVDVFQAYLSDRQDRGGV